MDQPLQTDLLLQMVGKDVRNHRDEFIGHIVEILRDKSGQQIQYLVLQSEECFGRGRRYFAIPASSTFVKIKEGGKIVLSVDKDKLQFAQGIAYQDCPEPDFKINPSIFELYTYESPINIPD